MWSHPSFAQTRHPGREGLGLVWAVHSEGTEAGISFSHHILQSHQGISDRLPPHVWGTREPPLQSGLSQTSFHLPLRDPGTGILERPLGTVTGLNPVGTSQGGVLGAGLTSGHLSGRHQLASCMTLVFLGHHLEGTTLNQGFATCEVLGGNCKHPQVRLRDHWGHGDPRVWGGDQTFSSTYMCGGSLGVSLAAPQGAQGLGQALFWVFLRGCFVDERNAGIHRPSSQVVFPQPVSRFPSAEG